MSDFEERGAKLFESMKGLLPKSAAQKPDTENTVFLPFNCARFFETYNLVMAPLFFGTRFKIKRYDRQGVMSAHGHAAPTCETVSSQQAIDFSKIDLAGWKCPCCKWDEKSSPYSWIHCNRCFSFSCGSQLAQTAGGWQFQCPRCFTTSALGNNPLQTVIATKQEQRGALTHGAGGAATQSYLPSPKKPPRTTTKQVTKGSGSGLMLPKK